MMCLVPRRAPFADWCAQIERMVERRTGRACHLIRNEQLRSCYNVGLSAVEMADDFTC